MLCLKSCLNALKSADNIDDPLKPLHCLVIVTLKLFFYKNLIFLQEANLGGLFAFCYQDD